MEKCFFSGIMRVPFLIFIFFISVSQVVSAPETDFRLKAIRFRAAHELAEKIYYKLEFIRFVNDLGYRESRNDWKSINCIGCFGEWQFAESTVRFLGYKNITLRKFKADPDIFPRELQVKVLESLIKVNLALLRDYDHFIGDTVAGVEITKPGLIAAAHLGGAGTVKKFLRSNGRINKKDVLGTSVKDYMSRFRDYDLGRDVSL